MTARVEGALQEVTDGYARIEGTLYEIVEGWARIAGTLYQFWPPDDPGGGGGSGPAVGSFASSTFITTIPSGSYHSLAFNTSAINSWIAGRTVTDVALEVAYGNVPTDTAWSLQHSGGTLGKTALSSYDYRTIRHSTNSTNIYSTYKVGMAALTLLLSGSGYLRLRVTVT